MATLEVHDGRGRVERVTIARDQPVMFGSSPKCDIVLSGEGVLPFHGRIRWKPQKQRFKIDASPDAQYLLINGHKMAASSFRQGDEVAVGNHRIFMINDAEPEPDVPPRRDDITRVQPPAFIAPPAPGTMIRRGSWRQNLQTAEPSVETALAEPEPAEEPKRRAREPRKPAVSPAEAPRRGWGRLLHVFSARAYAPGHEQILSSPLVFGLVGTLVVLALVGFALYGIIVRTAANRHFNQAIEALDDGDYRNAILRFDSFLKSSPDDLRAGKARVHRAMANVRQYTVAAGPSWSLALDAERDMVENVGELPEYRDSSSELAEQVIRTGEALADRARIAADERALADAESTVALHEKVAGKAAEALFKRSQLPGKLKAARAAVHKSQVRARALAAMDAALKAGSSSGVYSARDALVASYGDQAVDRELLARMGRANDLIKKAVTVDDSGRPAETEPHPDPFGPPTTLVLRAGEAKAVANGPLVYALADGFAFGIDGATGAPVWQVSVGLASPYAPLPIPGGTTALVFDARHDELVRLDGKTGKLVWRQELGEPVADPPLVLGNQLIQATPSGKLLVIDLASGALRAILNLGVPLTRTPVSDESGQALYVTAEKDNLFVLTRDPLGCAAVEYLGHDRGSIACPSARVGRYLIVAENNAINESRWRVLVIDEDGTKVSPVQSVPVLGWTWSTPATSGSVVWASGDRGGVSAYAIGAYGEKDPFRLIARLNPDAEPSGPAFALARSERELWVGSGRSGRYELDPEGGKLASTWTLNEAGPALAAPQLAGPLLVLTQQHTEGPGVALWGVEPQKGTVRWRTVLGAPWPSPPADPLGQGRLTALGVDGRDLSLSRKALTKGGFVPSMLPKPGGFRLSAESAERVEAGGWTALVPALHSSKLLVRGSSGEFKEVGLPAPVGAHPLAWGRELFVPGEDGRAYLIDPLTGESRAEPFVPPFDRTKPTRWRSPVRLGDDALALADDAGRVRRIVRANDPRPRLVAAAETSLGKELAAEPSSTKSAVVLATADGRIRALAARDLSPIGAWPLDSPLAVPPSNSGGRCFLADVSGGIVALGEDGQRLWSAKLEGKGATLIVAGPPAVRGHVVWFLASDGTLHARAVSDGSPVTTVALGVLPAGGPFTVGDDLVVPVGMGTLRLLTVETKAE
jgi:outer membrane protein assembly factor BamB